LKVSKDHSILQIKPISTEYILSIDLFSAQLFDFSIVLPNCCTYYISIDLKPKAQRKLRITLYLFCLNYNMQLIEQINIVPTKRSNFSIELSSSML
jgi:hypothetical protein